MSRGIDRGPEGLTIKLLRSRPDCINCPPAQDRIVRARNIFTQLHPFGRREAADVDSAIFVPDDLAGQEPVAALLGEYQAIADELETTQARCHNKTEEIVREGQTVGIYCPSDNKEYYFGEEV